MSDRTHVITYDGFLDRLDKCISRARSAVFYAEKTADKDTIKKAGSTLHELLSLRKQVDGTTMSWFTIAHGQVINTSIQRSRKKAS